MRVAWSMLVLMGGAASQSLAVSARADDPPFTFAGGGTAIVKWNDVASRAGATVEIDNDTAKAQTVTVRVTRLQNGETSLCKSTTPRCVSGTVVPPTLPAGESGTIVLKAKRAEGAPTAASYAGRLAVIDEATGASAHAPDIAVEKRTVNKDYWDS